MHLWDHLIQVASQGTAKQQLDIAEADGELHTALQAIAANTALDVEETFLQSAALAFNYRQAGATLNVVPEAEMTIAPQEEKKYCNPAAIKLLNEILDSESIALLASWLNECATHEQIVSPATIPALFDIAVANKKLQTAIARCCGKRGEWLIAFNSEWRFAASEDEEEVWQLGLTEQRKEALSQIRNATPDRARELLTETWDKEDAASKTALLAVLEEKISEADLPFLESIQNEKSKKVKEVVNDLLRRIPESSIVKLYAQVLTQAIRTGKEKSMLGLLSKKRLQIQLPSLDEAFFATGVDKLSNIKGLSDDQYIVKQLIASVPPKVVCEILQVNYTEAADLLTAETPQLLNAFAEAAIRFKDVACLREVITKDKTNFYAPAITFLSPDEANIYALGYFENVSGTQAVYERNSVIDVMCTAQVPFNNTFSRAISKHLAENVYQYNRTFFKKYIHLLHPVFIEAAKMHQPKETYYQSQWGNTVEYAAHLMQLRLNISNTFTHTTN